jgi:hypothetical protein
MAYTHVAAGMLANAAETGAETRTAFGAEELLHFSRLITLTIIGVVCA